MATMRTLRLQAKYNILTPVALLGLGLAAVMTPAYGQDVNNVAPKADGVTIANGFGLTNSSTITNTSGATAVTLDTSGGTVSFISNLLGATITGVDAEAVGIDGNVTSFNNSGGIRADSQAVDIGGTVASFVNGGTIRSNNNAGVGISDTVSNFVNSGVIQGAGNGVYFNTGATDFSNTGQILAGDIGVYQNDSSFVTNSFLNAGSIQSSHSEAVFFDGMVTSFANSSTIEAASNGNAAVYFEQDVAGFGNTGSIKDFNGKGVFFGGDVTSFANSGNITGIFGTAVTVDGAADTFVNSGTMVGQYGGFFGKGTVGSFSNTGAVEGHNYTGAYFAEAVDSFSNAGSITSDNYVGVYFASKGTSGVGSFSNAGTIKGKYAGVYSEGAVGSFLNSGSISADGYGVALLGNQEDAPISIANTGTIAGGTGPGLIVGYAPGSFSFDPESAAQIFNNVSPASISSFSNTGSITGRYAGVFLDNDAAMTAVNSGTIAAQDVSPYDYSAGFAFNGGNLINSGTISGGTGVLVNNNVFADETTISNSGSIIGTFGAGIQFSGVADPTIINSGLISGSEGIAVDFGGAVDDTIILQTGGKFKGDIAFATGSTNTIDVSGYKGNILLSYTGDDPTLVAGSGLYAQSGQNIAVMDDTAIREAAQPIEDLVGGVQGSISNALNSSAGVTTGDDFVSGYAASRSKTSAASATDQLVDSPVEGVTGWASLIGGGDVKSSTQSSTAFGGIIGGAQSQVSQGVVVGALGGYGRTGFSVTGLQTVTSDNGVVGVYGKAALDLVSLEFSVLAGGGANSSNRTVSTPTGDEVATGTYGSWFIAPELGVSMPVLTIDKGELGVTGKVGYIGGGFGGYTETGSTANATVGAENIGIFESSIELNGSTVIKSTDAGDIKFNGKVGLFAQINAGGSSVPVSMLGVATAGSSANGASGIGAYAGIGFDMPISASVSIGTSLDGSVRSDGDVGGSARVKLAGTF